MLEFSLIKTHNDYVANKPNFKRFRPGLYPTEASVIYYDQGLRIPVGECLRAAWYRSMQIYTPKPTSIGLNMKARLGKWQEEGLIDDFKRMGILVDNNIKFYNRNYGLSGELDVIIKNPDAPNQLIGYELKSFYNYNANRKICGAKKHSVLKRPIPGAPNEGHFLQTAIYAYEYRDELDDYRLMYTERGDGHRVEFRVGFIDNPDGTHQCYWQQINGPYWNHFTDKPIVQPYTIEQVYDRFKELIIKIRSKELPDQDYTRYWSDEEVEYFASKGEVGKTDYAKWQKNPQKHKISHWRCSYCRWADQCKKDNIS